MVSDGDLILVRELDEQLGLERLVEEQLSDSRQGLSQNTGGKSARSENIVPRS
jgi:phosphoserine phosphatase